jgi:pyruvate ferredoxin oxidoreductase beta subunit
MSTTQEQDLFDLLDVEDFKNRIVCGYNEGSAELGLPADVSVARSIIAPGTAALRDFSYIAPDIPVLDSANCVG